MRHRPPLPATLPQRRIDHLGDPLAPLFAYGAIDSSGGMVSISLRELRDDQVSIEIVSHSTGELPVQLEERRRWTYSSWKPGDPCHTLAKDNASHAVVAFTQNEREEVRDLEDCAGSLQSEPGMHQQNYVAFSSCDDGGDAAEDLSPTIRVGTGLDIPSGPAVCWHNKQQSGEVRMQGETVNAVTQQWGTGGNNVPFVGVRRLVPVECERLQGVPDDHTDGQSDSTRYRQLGNAVCGAVAGWIALRLAAVAAKGDSQ